LDGQITLEDSNGAEDSWDGLVQDINAGIEVLNMEGDDDDNILITEIN